MTSNFNDGPAGKTNRYGRKGPSDGSEPPTWAIATVVGSIVLVTLIYNLSGYFDRWIPAGMTTFFYAGLIALPMVTMICAAVASKIYDAKRSASWALAQGRVVKSGVGQVEMGVEDRTLRNVPAVEYEFEARGRKWRGARIAIDDPISLNIDETLKRYPAGATVTVHYNPKNPNECVLERDAAWLNMKGCLPATLAIAAVVAGVIYMFKGGYALVEASIPKPENAGFVVAATVFGLLVLLFFYGSRKMAKAASRWPSVTGRVMSSMVVAHNETSDGRTRTIYKPQVEFAYPINGQEYRSRQIKLNLEVSGSETYAQKVCAKYPEGGAVEVHYDPANPGTAALENPVAAGWLLLAVALSCFGIAAYAAGFFS